MTSTAANATKANGAKATDKADQAKADEADKAKANEAGKAIAVNRVNMANKANVASLAEANELLADGSIAVVVKYLGKLLTLLPFSLTKYSAIFAEVKGYFGIIEIVC